MSQPNKPGHNNSNYSSVFTTFIYLHSNLLIMMLPWLLVAQQECYIRQQLCTHWRPTFLNSNWVAVVQWVEWSSSPLQIKVSLSKTLNYTLTLMCSLVCDCWEKVLIQSGNTFWKRGVYECVYKWVSEKHINTLCRRRFYYSVDHHNNTLKGIWWTILISISIKR